MSSKIFALMTAWRSVSMKSKTRYMSLSFSALITFCRRMMFSWPDSSCRKIISLKVR